MVFIISHWWSDGSDECEWKEGAKELPFWSARCTQVDIKYVIGMWSSMQLEKQDDCVHHNNNNKRFMKMFIVPVIQLDP